MNETAPTIPYSREAEEAVIGATLINPDTYFEVADFLKPNDFYIHRHHYIWDAYVRLNFRQTPIDLLTVCNELERAGQLDDVGGSAYLTGLIHQVPTSLNAAAYGRIVQQHATRRKMLAAATNIAQLVYDDSLSLDELTNRCVEEVSQAVQDAMGRGLNHLSQGLSAMYEDMSLAAKQGQMPGLPTGLKNLDLLLGNLKPGLNIVAGRPGQGKTTLQHSIAKYAAEQGKRVAVFSLEMGEVEVAQRLTTNETEIDLSLIRAAQLNQAEWQAITQAVEELERLPIYVDESPELTVAQIEARCKRLEMSEGALDLVVVDYLQLVSPPFKISEGNRAIAVGAVVRGLRALSRKLNVPLLVGAQLNRESEREKRKPRLSDLRESGEIENEAHVVMFLYQDEEDHSAEIIVAKHRNGPTGSAAVLYRKEVTKFTNA